MPVSYARAVKKTCTILSIIYGGYALFIIYGLHE